MRLTYDELFRRATELSSLIGESDGSFDAIKRAARVQELWQDRYAARGAAEIIVATRDTGWEAIATYLAYRTIGDRDPVRNVLGPALRAAMLRDGVPRWVDRLARQYYEKPVPQDVPQQRVQELIDRLAEDTQQIKDQQIVYVPTTWEGWDAFQRLHEMMDDIANRPEPVIEFDFSRCTFLSPVGVAVLGGVARSLQAEGRHVNFRWDTAARRGVRVNLEQNGFAALHGRPSAASWTGNSVHYREDRKFDKRVMVGYLTDEWLAEDWIHLSNDLRSALVGTVNEALLTHLWVRRPGQEAAADGRRS